MKKINTSDPALLAIEAIVDNNLSGIVALATSGEITRDTLEPKYFEGKDQMVCTRDERKTLLGVAQLLGRASIVEYLKNGRGTEELALESLTAFEAIVCSTEVSLISEKIMEAITKGEIPHVSIKY